MLIATTRIAPTHTNVGTTSSSTTEAFPIIMIVHPSDRRGGSPPFPGYYNYGSSCCHPIWIGRPLGHPYYCDSVHINTISIAIQNAPQHCQNGVHHHL